MTQPGFVAPTTPGWWVRTNRIGTNKTGYNWDITAVGGRDSLGRASGSYGWAGSAAGLTINLRYIAGDSTESQTIAIPTHQVGDVLVICATSFSSFVSAPDPADPVPTWNVLDNDANGGGMITAYFRATATNTQSGFWSNANDVMVAVLRGAGPTPIGAHAVRHGASGTTVPSPTGMTLTNNDGSSQLLYFYRTTNLAGATWDGAPAGYTRRATTNVGSGSSVCFNTKDDTTSDGVVNQGTTQADVAYHSALIEILN